ncbi:MAG: DNA-directed RNA polymerase subunit A' [Thermoplasmata archaeon]|nr:DNA-directed RNA polymerase subunit A' [Thermoplasmata archaeon]
MNAITKRIGSIKFSCVSPDEIRKMSAVKIITADTYDDEGFPIQAGLMDPRMGVIEPGLRCKTCGCKVDECPGHFGHIELAEPIIHVGFIKDIKQMLESTCRQCGRLMLPAEEIAEKVKRMDTIAEMGGDTADQKNFVKSVVKGASGVTTCPWCGAEQVKIKLDKPTTFREVTDNHKLTAKEVRERLERIPDDDLKALGIDPTVCRPEWMVLTALPVPPVTVRPSITLDSGDRSEDDLTHKLVDVLRINQRLRENRDAGAPQLIVEDLWELLQYHITTYFDNQTAGIPPARHRSGRPLKTLAQRLKGKEGRFRSNLSGKRVNFSARTVISPDPNLSINEVGVPIAAARELTVPLHVNARNLEQMRQMVLRGTEPVDEDGGYMPGVNYVIRNDGRRIKVTDENKDLVAEGLDIDYVLERQLINGDVVLFNRQPSLHRMSIMAHRVRVMPGKTFRFNLCVCAPYNADFDGDEMNLHVLQSEEARAEARILMLVQENILSPRYGGPIIGGIHDHISGSFLLTHGDRRFGRWETMNILSKLVDIEPPEPSGYDEKGEPYWTGKDLFSLTLPDDFSITFKSSIQGSLDENDPEYDGPVVIENGKLISGTIDENAIGNSKGQILEHIARDYGADRATKFLNEVTRLSLATVMDMGFSTGISDEDLPDEDLLQIREVCNERVQKVDELIQSFNEDTFDSSQGGDPKAALERNIAKTLGEARTDVGRIAGMSLGMSNPAVIMAKTGARGSMTNLSQMAGCVGQQNIRGDRISRGYWQRTLPHFRRNDLGAYAKGFCSNSYKLGLTPTEFFFHAMGGREGLVDTAVRTSRSGYMQRRLVSALEDLKLTSDGTIRNTIGTIVQFKYGEDGIDPARSVRGKAIDINDLLVEVLGADAASTLIVAEDTAGTSYGTREKDLDGIDGMDSDGEGDEDSTDYGDDGDYDGGE